MPQNNTVKKAKILLDIKDDSKDDLLEIYLDMAVDYILDYTSMEEIPQSLKSVLVDMVIFQYRKKGVENVTTETMGSLYQSFTVAYPNNIMNRINKYKRALFL